MKGFYTDDYYFGWIPSRNEYQLFATEEDYEEYFLMYEA